VGAVGGLLGGEGGEGGGGRTGVGEDALRPEKLRGMGKWDLFQASVPVRVSKPSLEALARVQTRGTPSGVWRSARCAWSATPSQLVQGEAVRLAIVLTDEGNQDVQVRVQSMCACVCVCVFLCVCVYSFPNRCGFLTGGGVRCGPGQPPQPACR